MVISANIFSKKSRDWLNLCYLYFCNIMILEQEFLVGVQVRQVGGVSNAGGLLLMP